MEVSKHMLNSRVKNYKISFQLNAILAAGVVTGGAQALPDAVLHCCMLGFSLGDTWLGPVSLEGRVTTAVSGWHHVVLSFGNRLSR